MSCDSATMPHHTPVHRSPLARPRRAVEAYSEAQCRQMLLQLAELTLRQEVIIRNATKHIAELECQDVLRQWPAAHETAAECGSCSAYPDRERHYG